MQNQQMAQMANMNQNPGPVDGTPIMGNGQRRPQQPQMEPRDQLNTYIYDYFMRNHHYSLARGMLECDLKMSLVPAQKPSPSGRNINGLDGMEQDPKDDLPAPKLPMGQVTENSFLLDWWVQFWDIFSAARGGGGKGAQYISHARNLTQLTNEQRNQRMMMAQAGGMNQQQYANMMRAMPNGVAQNDLKRAAVMNRGNPNTSQMANMNQMKNQMMSTQMQRDGSQMDMNGRPQSPSSNENAPSPKRARTDGGMNPTMPGNQFTEFGPNAQNVQQKSLEVYAQSLVQQQRIALNNHATSQGINAGAQGSPMNQQGGLDGEHNMFVGNQPRQGMPAGAPGPPGGNHALQDYQMQLMLLEQQNKKRLLMARQEQDSMTNPHGGGPVGGPGFPPSMSPQGGSRAGPSPNPADMKKGTPRLNQQGLPGSPMPEGGLMQQRNSPTPNMPGFDPAAPPGYPPQYGLPGQMPQNNPMRMQPPSSHPGNFNGQQLTPQQMADMQSRGVMPNGAVWRGPQGQPGMMPNPNQQQMGPMGQIPQQRGQMPPPPAPANEQPRAQEPSPSQPAQAPPTPSTANKAGPKKKNTKDTKKPPNKKGANAGATPAASAGEEPPTPTPSTPITPMHPKSFGQNGQPPQPGQQPPTAQQQQPPSMDPNGGSAPFGNIPEDTTFELGLGFDDSSALENFDFDSFLHVGDDSGGFGSIGADFGFGDTAEVGGDL